MPSGWAESEGDGKVHGPFTVNMPPPGGVWLSEMPVGRPVPRPRPHIKGVPEASQDGDEDHRPGSGEWHDV